MRNVIGMGEVSASGLPGEVGVLVLAVPPQTPAAALGLRQGDVILKVGGQNTNSLDDLLRRTDGARVTVFRDQGEFKLGNQ